MDGPLALLVLFRDEHHAEFCSLPVNLVEECREVLAPKMLGIEVVVEHSDSRRSEYLRKFLRQLPFRAREGDRHIEIAPAILIA
jgi:hypothetical protein